MDTELSTNPSPATDVDAPPPSHPLPAVVAGWRVQAALCLAAFFAALNFFAPTPFYPEIARDLQTTVPLLGQVVTVMALLSAALGVFIGPLADRYGYRWPLVIGLLALAAALIGTGLAPNYPVLLGLGLLGGLGDALVFSLPFAIATTSFHGPARRQAIAWTIAALSIAPVVGVPPLTALGEATSWRHALALAGLAAAGVAGFVALTLPPDVRHSGTPFAARALLAAYTPLLRDAQSLRLLAVSGLRGLWWVGLLTYLGAYLGDVVGFSAAQIGLVYAVNGAAYAAGSVVAGRWLSDISQRLLVTATSLIGGGLAGAVLVLPDPWLVPPLLVVASIAASACSVGVVALLATQSRAGAGTTMVLNGSILNAGTAGGTVLGGLLIALGGFEALGMGLPPFALLAALLAWWPPRR